MDYELCKKERLACSSFRTFMTGKVLPPTIPSRKIFDKVHSEDG
jgi:hypothetical protein